MPRKKYRIKHQVLADPVYNDIIVSKTISKLTKKGKRNIAEKIFYGAMKLVEEKLKKPPLKVFEKAIKNITPTLEVKSRRVGGATFQVPVEISEHRQISLAIRWLINYAKLRKGKPMVKKLADEIVDAYNNTGNAVKKKVDTHKMAEANRAYAHFRW